jgi:hypothetical protein
MALSVSRVPLVTRDSRLAVAILLPRGRPRILLGRVSRRAYRASSRACRHGARQPFEVNRVTRRKERADEAATITIVVTTALATR